MVKRRICLCLAVIAPLAVVGATARASVWDSALTSPEETTAKELYEAKLLEGDAATLAATLQSASVKPTLDAIKRAETAYRAAAALRPRESEPYFRIGNLLYQMHFGCEASMTRLATCDVMYATPKRAELVVEAWNDFEHRAPLDPRVGEILLKRALLNTKLISGGAGDRKYLTAAARDYEAALDRSDGLSGVRGDEQLLGNLAETYMMLGRLEDAIATYQRAIAVGAARVSTVYGLAVALDRDGSGDQAMRRIQSQTLSGYDSFNKEYVRGSIFFVPRGESNYYFALANEAFGNYGAALEYWQRYITSGAHPEYHPRAREHIEQLRKKHVRAEPLQIDSPDDVTW